MRNLFIVPVMVLLLFTSCEKERLLIVNEDGSHYYEGEIEIVPDSKIMVQASNFGGMLTYSSAVSYCNSLNIEGMSGWRLPTRTEMSLIYNKTKLLNSDIWWTSTLDRDRYRFIFNAETGSFDSDFEAESHLVIAVRNR